MDSYFYEIFNNERRRRVKKPKILIVEDHENTFKIWKKWLDDKVEVIWAKTLAEGERLFKENSDIELVVMDCCVDNKETPDSMKLVQEIRESGFTKPIIAKSSDKNFLKVLRAVGADYQASAPPAGEVPELVLRLLKKAGEIDSVS